MAYDKIRKITTYKVGDRVFKTLKEAQSFFEKMNSVTALSHFGPFFIRKRGGSAQYPTDFVTCECKRCSKISEIKHTDVMKYKTRKCCDFCTTSNRVRAYLHAGNYVPNKLDFTGQLIIANRSRER